MNDLSQSIIALIEHHNQPTALGWFRKVDRTGFHLQQLPLSEVDFAILMSDFLSLSASVQNSMMTPAIFRSRADGALQWQTGLLRAQHSLIVH